MNNDARMAREQLKNAQLAVSTAEANIKRIESTCHHDWEEKYTPDYREAYTIPGDPPGTMGVDWRGPVHVPSSTTEKWTRTCKLCGKSETTTQKQAQPTQYKPFWRGY